MNVRARHHAHLLEWLERLQARYDRIGHTPAVPVLLDVDVPVPQDAGQGDVVTYLGCEGRRSRYQPEYLARIGKVRATFPLSRLLSAVRRTVEQESVRR